MEDVNDGDFPISRFLIVYLILAAATIGFCVCQCSTVERVNDWIGVEDDNPLEEVAEFIIKEKTGIDIDLTERSPE